MCFFYRVFFYQFFENEFQTRTKEMYDAQCRDLMDPSLGKHYSKIHGINRYCVAFTISIVDKLAKVEENSKVFNMYSRACGLCYYKISNSPKLSVVFASG